MHHKFQVLGPKGRKVNHESS